VSLPGGSLVRYSTKTVTSVMVPRSVLSKPSTMRLEVLELMRAPVPSSSRAALGSVTVPVGVAVVGYSVT
jgi:hypothetical protein